MHFKCKSKDGKRYTMQIIVKDGYATIKTTDTIDLNVRSITRDKREYFIMILYQHIKEMVQF